MSEFSPSLVPLWPLCAVLLIVFFTPDRRYIVEKVTSCLGVGFTAIYATIPHGVDDLTGICQVFISSLALRNAFSPLKPQLRVTLYLSLALGLFCVECQNVFMAIGSLGVLLGIIFDDKLTRSPTSPAAWSWGLFRFGGILSALFGATLLAQPSDARHEMIALFAIAAGLSPLAFFIQPATNDKALPPVTGLDLILPVTSVCSLLHLHKYDASCLNFILLFAIVGIVGHTMTRSGIIALPFALAASCVVTQDQTLPALLYMASVFLSPIHLYTRDDGVVAGPAFFHLLPLFTATTIFTENLIHHRHFGLMLIVIGAFGAMCHQCFLFRSEGGALRSSASAWLCLSLGLCAPFLLHHPWRVAWFLT